MRKFYVSILAVAASFSAMAESPVHSRVIDFVPAPGQFVNTLPEYEEGDDAAKIAEKAYSDMASGYGFISLGAWGGYVTVGFQRTIVNVDGKRDIYIEGNAFQAGSSATQGGSSEPGVVLVAYDVNKNGVPDDDEWFEIAGSEYKNSVRDYEVTYKRPSQLEKAEKVDWSDNKGNSGSVDVVYALNSQSYWPLWLKDMDVLKFKGVRLPDNGKNEGTTENPYYVLSRFDYGYADNYPNVAEEDPNVKEEGAYIDIDWAVDKNGNTVKMPGVDFVRIYTGVNQSNGWLGECSTEVGRVMNGHTTGIGKNEAVDESVVIDEKVLADFLERFGNGGVEEFSNNDVRIYVDRNGVVRFSLNSSASVSVYDQSGSRMYHAVCGEGENTIDISGYPSGLYIVKADSVTAKILKK